MGLDWEIPRPEETAAAEVTYFNWARRYKPGKFCKMVAATQIFDDRLEDFTLLSTGL